jgi:hypothetical protein
MAYEALGSASHGRSGYGGDGARKFGMLARLGPPWVPYLAGRHSVIRLDMGFGAATEPADYRWSVSELAAL